MILLQILLLIDLAISIDATSSVLRFLVEPDDATLFDHETTLLHCQAVSENQNATLYYEWTYHGYFLNENVYENGSILVRRKSFGQYRCFASDSFGTIRSKAVSVKKAGIFIGNVSLSHFSVKDESFVLIPYPKFTSNPPITSYHWDVLDQYTNKWRKINNNFYTINGSLFTQVSADGGNIVWYRLIVVQSSKLNMSKEVLNVSVSITHIIPPSCPDEKPRTFKLPPRNVNVVIGDSLILESLVAYEQCRNVIVVGWLYNRKQVSNASQLIIKNVNATSQGYYVFYALGNTALNHDVYVVVLERPIIKLVSSQHVARVDEKFVNISTGFIVSKFPFTLAWFVDGIKVEYNTKYAVLHNGSLQINSLDQADAGYYQVIYHVHGERLASTIKLKVDGEVPECGGKVVSPNGTISFFNVTSINNIKYSFFCNWFIKIPRKQNTRMRFDKLSFAKYDSCQKSHIIISFGNRTHKKKEYQLCTNSPLWSTNFSENGFFVTAYVNPEFWRNNGFVLSFYPITASLSTSTIVGVTPSPTIVGVTPSPTIVGVTPSPTISNTMTAMNQTNKGWKTSTMNSSSERLSLNIKVTSSIIIVATTACTTTSAMQYDSKLCCPTACGSCCIFTTEKIVKTISHSVCESFMTSISICAGCLTCCTASVENNYLPIVIALLASVIGVILITLGLCVFRKKKKHSTKHAHSKKEGRNGSLFGSKAVTQSESDLVTHMELEECENLAPCDQAFFGPYFAKKNSKKSANDQEKITSAKQEEGDGPNLYASLKARQPAYELDYLDHLSSEKLKQPANTHDIDIPVYKEVEHEENIYADSRDDLSNENKKQLPEIHGINPPVYRELEHEENIYADSIVDMNSPVYQMLAPETESDQDPTTNENKYQTLTTNQNKYQSQLTNQSNYQELLSNKNNDVYASPVVDSEEQGVYQSLTPSQIDSTEYAAPIATDVLPNVEGGEHTYQPLSPLKTKELHIKSDYMPLSTSSLPNSAKLLRRNNADLAPYIHKSGSQGGKYNTEDYVLM